MAILCKIICIFHIIPTKIQVSFLAIIDRLVLIDTELQGAQQSQTVLKQKNVVWGLTLHSFKTYYKVVVVKMVSQSHRMDGQITGTELRAQK